MSRATTLLVCCQESKSKLRYRVPERLLFATGCKNIDHRRFFLQNKNPWKSEKFGNRKNTSGGGLSGMSSSFLVRMRYPKLFNSFTFPRIVIPCGHLNSTPSENWGIVNAFDLKKNLEWTNLLFFSQISQNFGNFPKICIPSILRVNFLPVVKLVFFAPTNRIIIRKNFILIDLNRRFNSGHWRKCQRDLGLGFNEISGWANTESTTATERTGRRRIGHETATTTWEVELFLWIRVEQKRFGVVGEFAEKVVGSVVDDDESGTNFDNLTLSKLKKHVRKKKQ